MLGKCELYNRLPSISDNMVSMECNFVSPAPITVENSGIQSQPTKPSIYNSGFDSRGRIVGVNAEVPYPRQYPWYHDIPFRRMVDWFVPAALGKDDQRYRGTVHRTDISRPGGKNPDSCTTCDPALNTDLTKISTAGGEGGGCKVSEGSQHESVNEEKGVCCTDKYTPTYLVKGDPVYKAWVDKKIAAQRARDLAQIELRKVPSELRLDPAHYGPSMIQTSNEAYGQHLDMVPEPPKVYPWVRNPPKPLPVSVKFRRSNFSDHPPIPDHGFAVPRFEQEAPDGEPLRSLNGAPYISDNGGLPQKARNADPSKKIPTKYENRTTIVSGEGVRPPAPGLEADDPWSFHRSFIVLGRVAGEREKGSTWPLHVSTGLELNRPVPKMVKMSVGYPFSEKATEDTELPVHCKDGVYNSRASDLVYRFRKTKCAPRDPGFNGLCRRQGCHRDFINPEYLPIPLERRKDRSCDPRSLPLPCDDPRSHAVK